MKLAVLNAWLIACAVSVSAQQPAAPADFAATLKNQYNQNKGYLLAAAEKWPEDQFAWRPAGLEAELRTFGQILAHIANENNMVCARVTGQPMPKAFDDSKGVFTKADATQALKDGFAMCDPVYNSLTNQNIVEMMKVVGRNNSTVERPRGTTLVANVAHSNEQYGQVMVYFALKGMVPPSHAR
jgi:hypothetical protein